MPNFVIEIYGEEIPPKSQSDGENIFRSGFTKFIEENQLNFNSIETFSTSRRIILMIHELEEYTKEQFLSVRGPLVSANENAINGFMKSNQIKDKKNLKVKTIKDKKYYFLEKKISKKKTISLLKDFIPEFLKNFKWKKSMRWGDTNHRWIRPIKSILCLFNERVVDFSFCGINSSDFTFGNYLFTKNKIICKNINELKKKLYDNFVIIDIAERKKKIIEQLKKISSKHKVFFEENEKLLKETASLVEYPNLFSGSFDESFFSMPEFLMTSVLRDQQKYFCFRDQDNKLTNLFAFVTNHKNDLSKKIISGNETVLKARFNDALFFLKEDCKLKLEERLHKLKKITYLEDLGTIYEKSERIVKLSTFLSKLLNFQLNDNSKKLIFISKTDLTTELVKEFPNLQGLVGSYYSKLEGYSKEYSDALKEQYTPISSKDNCPKSNLSICLSISDKIDQITSVFLSGKKPTGSSDPFALRRSALGIIRTLIENKINIDIKILIEENLKLFTKVNTKEKNLINNIVDFINVRLFIFLKDYGIPDGVLKSIIDVNNLDPYMIYHKAQIISKFIITTEGKNFLNAYKRLDSILDKSVRKKFKICEELFASEEEEKLYNKTIEIQNKITIQELNFEFYKSLIEIQKLRPLINSFFDKVKVNVDDSKKKENRKEILILSKLIIDKVCNFSFIE